jgi:hypothetical protein
MMKQFPSIEKLDTGILYALELASSLSVLFLAFGLIASMANVLTKGSVLTDNLIMQRIWAWTQCIAIDASVAGTIIRTFRFYHQGERVKTWLYGLLSALLLFTAAIVSNIEAVQQTLNVTLGSAYLHVFVPVEALIWIRSLAIVLLIVAHAMRHVQIEKQEDRPAPLPAQVTPELLSELRVLLTQPTVSEEQPETPQIAETATATEVQENAPKTETITLPGVTREDAAKVIQAFQHGVSRRRMCAHLKWGSSKYATIVKPVLDSYEQRERHTETREY